MWYNRAEKRNIRFSGGTMQDQHAYNRQLIEAFRANRGKSGGPTVARPLLLLTTTGAKSGQARTSPLMYIPDGDHLLVFASNYGAPKHPDWYHNLLVHPNVTVEVGSETYHAIAVPLMGIEREQTWARMVEHYPSFAELQTKTSRQIPIVALKR
jgi:deazaflavin-dependent oxidoreductase (nitroreductase family)